MTTYLYVNSNFKQLWLAEMEVNGLAHYIREQNPNQLTLHHQDTVVKFGENFTTHLIDINHIIDINKRKGFRFFSDSNMKAFSSRVSQNAIVCGIFGYFVSSERDTYTDQPRLYTIRKINLVTGEVKDVSEFQEYSTLKRASSAMKKVIKTYLEIYQVSA